MGEQEGEEESTTVAIVILAKRNLRSKEMRRVRTEWSLPLEFCVSYLVQQEELHTKSHRYLCIIVICNL